MPDEFILRRAYGKLTLTDGRVLTLDGDTFTCGGRRHRIGELKRHVAPFRVIAVSADCTEAEAAIMASVSRGEGEAVDVGADTAEAANFLIAALS